MVDAVGASNSVAVVTAKRAHIARVLDELSQRDTNHLSHAQLERRTQAVELLRDYAAQGRFPVNTELPQHELAYFIDKNGKHSGFSADILQLVGRRLGLKIDLVPGLNWKSVLAKADAERYQHQVTAFREGGQIYLWREYLSVLDEFYPDLRKKLIVTSSVDNWVHELDLTDNIETSLFEGAFDSPVQEN